MSTQILLDAGTNELEIVEFCIDAGGYRGFYGINVAKVVEILRYQKTTAVPETPHPAVVGMFAYRTGRVVPVLDLSIYFGTGPLQHSDAKLIITEFNRATTAFIVSGVTRIHRLSWTQVETPDRITQSIEKQCITAFVRLEDRITFIVDLESIVADLYPDFVIRFEGEADYAYKGKIPIRILHVDDSETIRRLVRTIMDKDRRFQLVQAENGQEALNMLLALRDSDAMEIDAVITDIEMPQMDGLTLCKKIKEDSILKNIPVAIFSSLVNDDLVRKCQSVGADAQYNKPDLEKICRKVTELVSLKQ